MYIRVFLTIVCICRELVSRAPCMLIRPDGTETSSKKMEKKQESISDSFSTGSLRYSVFVLTIYLCIDVSIAYPSVLSPTGSPLQIKVIDNCDTDLDVAMEYVCRLEDILKSGVVCNDNNNMLGGAYNRSAIALGSIFRPFIQVKPNRLAFLTHHFRGYKRLLTLLRDAGCKFSVGQLCRPLPTDRFEVDIDTHTFDCKVLYCPALQQHLLVSLGCDWIYPLAE